MTDVKIAKIEDFSSNSSICDSELGKGVNDNGYDIDRSNGGSSWFAYYNLVCLTLGTGMLGLPSAVSQGGWGAVALIIGALVMSTYGGVILQPAMYRGKNRRLNSYKELGNEAFGKIGGWLSFFFITWVVLGTPVLYLVLSAQNLDQLCKGTAGELGTFKWTIVWAVVVGIPYIFIKTMNNIAWVSAFGMVAMIVTIIITVVLSGVDYPNQLNNHHDNVVWDGFPIALSTIAFSAGSNTVYTSVEGSMKTPKQWPKVIIGCLSTCSIFYLMLAISGYYVYGINVLNPVYNSVPDGPARSVAIVLVTINVIVSCPILLVSFALEVEDMLNITVERFGKKKEFLIRAAFRTAVMVFITAVGILIPFFGLLMSLIGAFANSSIVFILPVLFYWRLTGFRNKNIIELAWNFLILIFGFVAMIFGTWASIEDLIKEFKNGYTYSI
ncbi:transmembrane amino acid transporter protein-domain-containing protein [Phascolomyces articulosus]|uniref:Transmembrane amino acid transporter protein-domain-containing protein n=1 Tax=Phascolomyces articulosus TaxID=60185 RepID=A0AAD5PHV1_9FUNG|nr:transmembrane amino acid transporter protein-domain-containing protein [Phascolomyces articulosus]